MSDQAVLSETALGDLAGILPGAALADATGGPIRPDPDARPRRRQEPPEPEHPRSPERDPPDLTWVPSAISVTVQCGDQGLEGYASVGGRRQRISPGVIRVAPGGRFRIDVFYHVDAKGMPRPPPIQPPQVGLQWFFTPDGGDASDTSVSWDPAPTYGVPGDQLVTHFDNTVGFAVPESGWLTLSARIDDPAGAAEFDDTIRLLVE